MKVKCAYDELVSLKKLIPHPKNRNKHPKEQIVRLAKVLEYQGVRRPVRVSELSGYITAGHCLYEAAKLLKWKELPVDYQPYDSEDQEIADGIADNSIALWADLDFAGINMDVPGLGPDFDIDWLGIKDFVIEPAEKIFMVDEDSMPSDDETKTRVKPGQIWQLGAHRIMCGDSTDKANIDALMNGEKADMVFTDPPYGMNAVHNMRVISDAPTGFGKTTGKNYPGIVKARLYKPVHGDDKDFDASHTITLAPKCFLFGANHYSNTLPLGRHWLVWDKKCEKGTDEGPFSDCELMWTNIPDRNSVKIYRFLWAGLLRSGNRDEELVKRVHPTQKPVGLCADIISDYSKIDEKIIDPFLGSGSTLIACEKTNRKCYGLEIDPHYCDVIIARWERFTGQKAILANG